ncbi:MAG: polysaccharide lyase, partial [Planctomycetes bacterium]|nr:polysaccharide lyase [Planctomycetota bacterium]
RNARCLICRGGLLALVAAAGACAGETNAPIHPADALRPTAAVPKLRDGFESGRLATFWRAGDGGSGRYAAGAIVVTDACARAGERSARITVREGDVAQRTESGVPNERAELDSCRHVLLGRDVWCGFSFLLGEDFPIVDVRLVLSQWKQSGLSGSPIVAQRFRAGRHYLTVRDLDTPGERRERVELPAVAPGRWNDMVFHVRFATDSRGLIELWMNGELVASVRGPTAAAGAEPAFYHKVGLYRDRMTAPMTLFLDNYALGDSFEAVDPARFDAAAGK